MKTYKVIHVAFPHKSFSWADGLYAIIKKDIKDNRLDLCKIDEQGKPQMYGENPSISSTSINNPGITKTNLTIKI